MYKKIIGKCSFSEPCDTLPSGKE